MKIFPAELEHQNEFKHFMEKKYTEQQLAMEKDPLTIMRIPML